MTLIVLRERYVRDDIPCGFEDCRQCRSFPGYKAVLPRIGFTKHSKYDLKQGHYLVVDTNIVLHQVSRRILVAFIARDRLMFVF